MYILTNNCEIFFFFEDDPGAAEVGVTEITDEIKRYSHPKQKNLKFYDLPVCNLMSLNVFISTFPVPSLISCKFRELVHRNIQKKNTWNWLNTRDMTFSLLSVADGLRNSTYGFQKKLKKMANHSSLSARELMKISLMKNVIIQETSMKKKF